MNPPRRRRLLTSVSVAVCVSLGAAVPAIARSVTVAPSAAVSMFTSDRPGHVYRPGEQAEIRVASGAARVEWRLLDIDVKVVASGTGRPTDGGHEVVVPAQPNGRYRLAAVVDGGERSTGVAWVPETTPDAAFGLVGKWVSAGSQPNWAPESAAVVRAIGVGTVRTSAQWTAVEREVGVYDFRTIDERIAAIEGDVSAILVPLTYGHPRYTGGTSSPPVTDRGRAGFAAYARATIEHLEDRFPDIDFSFEVYNEWRRNIPDSVDQYIRLLSAVADAVCSLGARSPLVGGVQTLNSVAEHAWWTEFLQKGGADHVDVISVHPYLFQKVLAGPDLCERTTPYCTEDGLAWLRAQIDASTAEHRPLWVSENGLWGAPGRPGTIAPGLQAAYLVRAWAVAAKAGVERYVVYEALDETPKPEFTPEDHFGLFEERTSDWGAKNTAVAYATLIRQLSGKHFVEDRSVGDVRELVFADRTITVRILWSGSNDPIRTAVSLDGPGTMTELYGAERPVTESAGKLSVTVRAAPVFLAERA